MKIYLMALLLLGSLLAFAPNASAACIPATVGDPVIVGASACTGGGAYVVLYGSVFPNSYFGHYGVWLSGSNAYVGHQSDGSTDVGVQKTGNQVCIRLPTLGCVA